MKQDVEVLREMLTRAGIEFSENWDGGTLQFIVPEGYVGFYVQFEFSANGALKTVAAYE